MKDVKALFIAIIVIGVLCIWHYVINGAGDVFGAVGGTCVLFGLLFLWRFSGE